MARMLIRMDSEQRLDPNFVNTIIEMAIEINELNRQGVELLRPELDFIIRNKITDTHTVERLLDQLLDYASSDEGLHQFKKLLRYFYPINPESTAFYIYAYHDMYEDDFPRRELAAYKLARERRNPGDLAKLGIVPGSSCTNLRQMAEKPSIADRCRAIWRLYCGAGVRPGWVPQTGSRRARAGVLLTGSFRISE